MKLSAGFTNAVKICLVFALFCVLITTLGFYWNRNWLLIFLDLADLYCLIIYLVSDRILLFFSGAKLSQNQDLNNVAQGIIPGVKVYFVRGNPPKLFSLGTAVCLTEATLPVLGKQELEVLLIRERILIKGLFTRLRGTISVLYGPLSFVALELFVPRSVETQVDYETASITGEPDVLASALEKMSSNNAERVQLLRSL